ncbi:MAG: radical SAM protein [Candidatus Omnitrophota bacterium]
MYTKISRDMNSFFIKQLINFLPFYLKRSSKKGLVRLFELAARFAHSEESRKEISETVWRLKNNHGTLKFFKRLIDELNPQCMKKFFTNAHLVYHDISKIGLEFREREGFRGPDVMVIDVTSRCNLRCRGCWAGEYDKKAEDLDMKLIEKAIDEARYRIGLNHIAITGGEPLIRENVFDIFEKYSDCQFILYTNGTLLTDEKVKKIAELGNVYTLLSIEGNEEFTDARRGKGVYEKVMNAMDKLRKAGVIFGFSSCPTRSNVEYLTSDEFIDKMLEKGCHYGFYFQYVPVGRDPDTEIMPTPAQRNDLRYNIYRHRNTKPLLLIDFWNDGPEVNGCMAGGRKYFHITNNGDIEPCVFVHFAAGNIKDMSVTDALKTPFFTEMRNAIPYDGNLLKPCMIIDRPEVLRNLVEKHKPYASDRDAELLFTKCNTALDKYSREFSEIIDKEWAAGKWMNFFPSPEKPEIVRVDPIKEQ